MIKINKPVQIPITLRARGVVETQNDCDIVGANHGDFLSGDEKLRDPISEVYGSIPVKRDLVNSHNGKCCYCERSRDKVEVDVEHFRPKRAVAENREDTVKLYPGYYWLAYNWDNLFLSCKGCNQTWKKCSFPLSNPANRSRWHNDVNTVENELPLLANPAEEPREHIRFDNEAPRPIDEIGQVTIRELGLLERSELEEARLKVLKNLRKAKALIECLKSALALNKTETIEHLIEHQDMEEAITDIETATLPSSEFTSMALDFLNGYIIDAAVLTLIRG